MYKVKVVEKIYITKSSGFECFLIYLLLLRYGDQENFEFFFPVLVRLSLHFPPTYVIFLVFLTRKARFARFSRSLSINHSIHILHPCAKRTALYLSLISMIDRYKFCGHQYPFPSIYTQWGLEVSTKPGNELFPGPLASFPGS